MGSRLIERTGRLTRTCLAAVAVTAALVVAGSASPANAAGFACTATHVPAAGRFDVTWTGSIDGATRYVIERNAFGDWYWAGRASLTDTRFESREPNPQAIQVLYRVKGIGPDNVTVVGTTDCTVTFPVTFQCNLNTFGIPPGTHVRWTEILGNDVDYVVNVRAASEERFWWQNRTEATSQVIGPRWDNKAPDVMVTARRAGRVIATDLCEWPTEADFPLVLCVTYPPGLGWQYFDSGLGLMQQAFPFDRVIDWYRQTVPGGPWEFRQSLPTGGATQRGSLRQDPLPTTNYRDVLYRAELWNAAHTVLQGTAVCDPGIDSNRS